MNKKQLRVYAKKFESASGIARIIFGIIALLGFLKLMDLFTNATLMYTALGIYAGLLGFGYWWVRREWLALLAPPPKPVRKKKPTPVEPKP